MGSRDAMGRTNRLYFNGLLPNEADSVIRPLDPQRWARAEARTAQLISRIQPNWPSEKHRNAVASYVQRLITDCVPCQVFTFGSVPLKTYLPDGDIDLTAFSEDQNVKDNWAHQIRDMLKREEKNEQAQFQVKEVQYIEAEVKIIKCLVDNIVVDISFNQIGGLCTLCFLEEVDNLINQDHLFKRSIVLIKAWCYYESRILGAHYGLISTYALETLVLYIFHVYNNSFAGPLEVLYRFLEFFGKFDWANFCVSLWGPVPVSSLPCMAADPPRKDDGELLLKQMFLSACGTAYSVFPGGHENKEPPFVRKNFNVVDPLRINNNLGRSVSQGNLYRIRSAFSFGAQQLARILECKEEEIAVEVDQFFVNTWERHGKGCRPDAPTVDSHHMRQVHTEYDGNHRKHNIGGYSEVGRFPGSLDSSLQPGMSSGNPIARTGGALTEQKDSTSEGASGSDCHYNQRSDLPKKLPRDVKETSKKGHSAHQFARTCSSPELTNMSSEVAPRHNIGTENTEDDTSMSSYTRTRGSGITVHPVGKCSSDQHRRRESSSRDNHLLGNFGEKSVTGGLQPAFSVGDEAGHSPQDEQDFMNLKSSSGIQNYGGHLQMSRNQAYPPPFIVHPSFLSHGHHGMTPANISPVESGWGNIVHFSGSPYPTSFPQHFNAAGGTPDQAGMIGRLNGSAESLEVDRHSDDCGSWTDCNAGSLREIDPKSEDFSTASYRLSPTSPATSSRPKGSSGSSWEGNPSKITSPWRNRWVKKTRDSHNSKINSGCHDDGESRDQTFDDVDDDPKEWVPVSTVQSAPSVSSSVSSKHVGVHQVPGFGPARMGYPNSMLPFAPLLVRPGSEQCGTGNHAVLPVTFYPAGPPVPFVTMMTVHGLPTETGTSVSPASQQDLETRKDSEHLSHTDNCVSTDGAPSREHTEERASDIFNSDFASHWKNLQYGRFCQSSRLRHPFFHPPVPLTPQYLQVHLPFDDPGKASPGSSADVFAHLVPLSSPTPGSENPVGVSGKYGGEVSKHRNGTGTYFPNPNIVRDRCSTSRQYRGDYNRNRHERHGDMETNWNFHSKPRFTGRADARSHYEKPSTRMDQSAASASQTDRPRGTFRHSNNHSYRSPNGPAASKPAHNDDDNVEYPMYRIPPAQLKEVPLSGDAHPFVMMYPCPQTTSCGSSTEQLQFGSVGPEHLVGSDEVPELRGY